MKSLRKIVSGAFKGPRTLITDRLFPHFFASLDYKRDRRLPPLNRQSGRAAIVERIINECAIQQIVETGTYRGASTAWFAGFGLPVFTVEKNPRFAQLIRLIFADNPLVHPFEMDSVAFLDRLSKDDRTTQPTTLFYLDAHWGKHLPLSAEIQIVARSFPDAVVVIDDFEVPDDPDYRFDDFGRGKRLDVDYVKRAGVAGLKAFFPVLRGIDEDGARRGCIVLTRNSALAERLQKIPLLRPYPLDGRGANDQAGAVAATSAT